MLRALRNKLRDRRFRRDHPDLYDDRLHNSRLNQLAETVAARSIAIVGNAESIFESKNGERIDSHDLVLRINRGFIRDTARQGARTDILCLATSVGMEEIGDAFGSPEIIFATPNRWGLSPSLLDSRPTCFPLDHWKRLSEMIGGRRPSAGLISVYIARYIFRSEAISLFGFDWKATKTFYSSRLRTNHHDWNAERRLMAFWAEQGWLRLPPRLD